MMTKVYMATRETRVTLPERSMADEARNGGSQTETRESDTVIVPKIAGNAGEGKDGT